MAENVVLTNLANLQNDTTTISVINGNNAIITSAFSDVLSRTGVSPNPMQANLDMNNFNILNLPAPNSATSPARLQDIVTTNITFPPRGQILGSGTNDAATTGNLGEYVSSTIAQGSAVAATNLAPATLTSISLTAGDWDIGGGVYAIPAATTNVSAIIGSISFTTNSLNLSPGYCFSHITAGVIAGTFPLGYTICPNRISLASTTTVFLTYQINFTVSTCGAFGTIFARRAR